MSKSSIHPGLEESASARGSQPPSARPAGGATRRQRRSGTSKRFRLPFWVGPALLVLAWDLAVRTGTVDATFLSPPLTVADTMWRMIADGELWDHLAASLIRVLGGFIAATVAGILIGVAMGMIPLVNDLLKPVIELIRPISPIAWIPLAILWFGLGNGPSWFIIFITAIFPIVLNTYKGVTSVALNDLRAAACCGIKGWALARKVLIPSALPDIMTGARIGLGIGWMAVIAAELVAAQSGLGYLIEQSRQLFDTPRVLVGMVTIGIVGFCINFLMERIERRLTAWKNI